MAVAISATGCGAASQDQGQAPPPPSVTELSPTIPAHPDDGLHRLVVTPLVPTDPAGDDAPSVGHWTVGPGHLDVASEATLVFQDGVPGFVDDTGAFVPLGDSVIDALARRQGVVSLTPIGDGSYALVAESPDVVEGLGLEVMDDLALGFNEDTYGGYQWALDNNGHNLDPLSSPPPQVADADVDGVEAAPLATGRGVVVAVVDSGVDFSHPDLAGKSWVNTDEDCANGIDDDANGFVDDCRGWDFAAEDNVPFVPGHHAHGTHVAGIIAATAGNGQGIAGMAPDVQIMDLSVTASGSMTTSSIARAIRYAADNGADVVNLSLGTAPGVPISAVAPIVDAVHYAESAGVLLVVAAGNDGIDLTAAPVYPASIEATNLLTVGASSPAETKSGFSNYGTAVELFAPGELIVSTIPNNDYTFMSGTSQATPLTAAVAALVLEQRPDADPVAVINQLVGTADELPAYAAYLPSSARLNAARAVGGSPSSPADGAPPIVVVRGLADAAPDEVTAEVALNAPSDQYGEPFRWEASLVSVRPDGIYAVVDHQLSVGGADVVTDDRGAMTLGQESAMVVDVSTSLPPGTYGLVVEAVPTADATLRLDDAFITTFVVNDPNQPTATTAPPTTAPPTTAPPTTAPVTSAPATTSPTSSPAPSTTSSPAPTYPETTYAQTTTSAPSTSWWQPITSTTTTTTYAPVPTYPETTSIQTTTSAPSTSWWQPITSTTTPATTTPATTTTTTWLAPSPAPVETTSSTAPSPTSAPSTPSAPTPTPGPTTTTGPGDVVDGGWAIASITPQSGPVDGETFLSLAGTFPQEAAIWFGDLPGTVYAQSSTWMVVRAPAASQPGTVELTVRTRADGVVLTVPEAFTYLAADGPADGGGGGTTPSTTAPTPSTAPSLTTSTTSSPSTGPTTSSPASTGPTTTSTSSPETTGGTGDAPAPTDPVRETQVRAQPVGDPIDLGDGLRGRPLPGLAEINDVPTCSSSPCRTRRIQR
jgi:subtilisin family serine protease